MSSETKNDHDHRVMNALAALLVNVQLLEAAFEEESAERPLLASSREERESALIAVKFVGESTRELVSLLQKRDVPR